MFSNGSSNSISFAIVTPSFVISGAPNDLSNTTLRPFGPIVTLTVSANWFTPASRAFLASIPYLISFAMILLPPTKLFCNKMILRFDYSTTAKISFCFTMIYSSSSNFTSVPAYLE